MNISPTGCWLCETKEPHGFDEALAAAIVTHLSERKIDRVIDFGCGSGAYVEFLRSYGILAVGFDGNPHTQEFARHCYVADLSRPFDVFAKSPCVISLETGEHIPAEFEDVFIENLINPMPIWLFLSWYPRPGQGIGHVNERSNEYIVQKLKKHGYIFMDATTAKMREVATCHWFKESFLAFCNPLKVNEFCL